MLYDRPKIDCHCHVFDPDAFPYAPDTPYAPAGGEIATADYFGAVMDAYGAVSYTHLTLPTILLV